MYKQPDKNIKVKQFKLPIEEERLNTVYNNHDVVILDERVFQDRTGDIVVFLKWEEYIIEEEIQEEELFSKEDECV